MYTCVRIGQLTSISQYFRLFIIIIITQTNRTKNITITRYYCLFPEVKMVLKIKKHNLCSNWQVVFTSCTHKQTLIDHYEIFSIKNFKKICKLTLLEYFQLPKRIVLVIAASAWFKILLSILAILLRRVALRGNFMFLLHVHVHLFLILPTQNKEINRVS